MFPLHWMLVHALTHTSSKAAQMIPFTKFGNGWMGWPCAVWVCEGRARRLLDYYLFLETHPCSTRAPRSSLGPYPWEVLDAPHIHCLYVCLDAFLAKADRVLIGALISHRLRYRRTLISIRSILTSSIFWWCSKLEKSTLNIDFCNWCWRAKLNGWNWTVLSLVYHSALMLNYRNMHSLQTNLPHLLSQ